ncbi:hypothetical protein [Paenibacillus prosopidis]|uniref:Uncharacterized protein n=1 Tax=Paenibacillus prosopidis TaxID=630520 RepID=A0A368W873_9BACL|nr:hypothetical protein [Paenibacillus prosopidis]RCW50317.1 hypothetical protein DFP97_103338 [Paenibacillus prosopidis]
MKVVTLCGSTKFKKQFEQANGYLTLQGNIVLSLAFFEQSEGFEITQEQAELLGKIHLTRPGSLYPNWFTDMTNDIQITEALVL